MIESEWFGDWENIFEIKWEFLRANKKMSEQMFVVVVFLVIDWLIEKERMREWEWVCLWTILRDSDQVRENWNKRWERYWLRAELEREKRSSKWMNFLRKSNSSF